MPIMTFAQTLALFTLLVTAETPEVRQPTVYQVIVNGENPHLALTNTEISDLMLKKQGSWRNGVPVSPVDLLKTSPVRAASTLRSVGLAYVTSICS